MNEILDRILKIQDKIKIELTVMKLSYDNVIENCLQIDEQIHLLKSIIENK